MPGRSNAVRRIGGGHEPHKSVGKDCWNGLGWAMSNWRPTPCNACGVEPKESGRGKRYCTACRERTLPIVERAAARRKARKKYAENVAKGIERKLFADAPEGMKWCPQCSQFIPLGDFSKRSGEGSRAYASACKPCTSNYHYAHTLKTQFGITLDEYDVMLSTQGGRCAICECRPRTRRLAVDHNHKTGAIRGLLCMRCNHKLLGAAHDNPAILRRAAFYLENPPAQQS